MSGGDEMRKILKKRSKGQALVEFALVLPLLLLLVMGIIDFGLIMQQYLTLQHSVREGARMASVGGNDTDVISRVEEILASRWASDEVTVNVAKTNKGTYEESVVTVNAPVAFITPLESFVEGLVPNWQAQAVAAFRSE
jgi:Flp pilus assembly protein TadG